MRPIDMLSACVIGGAGALVGAQMMLIARQAEPSLRSPLNACLWGFVVLAAGLMQNAFTDTGARWPILLGALTTLTGTMLIARGMTWSATGCRPRRGGIMDAALLGGALLLAWPQGPYVFGLAFHASCFLVALGLAWSFRRALLAPRSAAERSVAATLVVYAGTWVYGFYTAARYSGPELRHLMYMDEPMLTVYALTYALMPLTVGALVLNMVNAQLGQRLRTQASTDELTGLLTRRALRERADRWQAGALARGRLSVVLLVDVDHFKRINDTRGHECGDDVLRAVSGRMRGHLRADSLLARYGGEEFLVLLEAATMQEAAAAAERLRATIGDAPFAVAGAQLPVTASIGVAAWPAGTEFARALGAADIALYAAKRGGRDRIVVSGLSNPDDAPAVSPTEAAAPGTL